MGQIKKIWKQEPVFFISALCTLFSMLFVPPNPGYSSYVDFRVLILLFCLMAVVAGVQKYGLFSYLAQILLSGKKGFRTVFLLLILLPFFTSMLITNDVALLTFVPFAILVLELCQKEEAMIPIIVLQTVAANLGSMATPVGNPQNLFLYSHFPISTADFFEAVLPYVLMGLFGFFGAAAFQKREAVQVAFSGKEKPSGGRLLYYGGLFFLCLLCVFHVLPSLFLLGIVAAAVWAADRELLAQVDYVLLGTFVCFFIFAGNIGQIPEVSRFFGELMEKNTLFASAAASQVISNVPAAVLLSGFTENWKGLLLGTNLGGLGTPVASLASLISMRFYIRREGAKPLRYFFVFMFWNIMFLSFLILGAKVLGEW